MAPFTIVLVRHGESQGNKENYFCGWYDSKLTEKGKQEAHQAGKTLKAAGLKFDIAYTSVLSRAQDTLQSILVQIGQTDLPVVKTWRLNERHFGGLTGLKKNKATEKYGEELLTNWRKNFNFDVPLPPLEADHPYHETIVKDSRYSKEPAPEQFPKFETLRTAVERTLFFWNDSVVPQIISGKQVIIVSHENPLRGIVQHLDKMTNDQIMMANLPNAVPIMYTLDENLRPIKRLEFLGDPATVSFALKAMTGEEDVF